MDNERELLQVAVAARLISLTEKHMERLEANETIKDELRAILDRHERDVREKAYVCALFLACAIAIRHGRVIWWEIEGETNRLLDPNAEPLSPMGQEVCKVRDRLVKWIVRGIRRDERGENL